MDILKDQGRWRDSKLKIPLVRWRIYPLEDVIDVESQLKLFMKKAIA